MARAATNQAKDTFGQAKSLAGTTGNNANDLFSTLMPQYEAEANNPTGIGASGLAAEDTAAQQSTGGSTSGAVGQGNLMAARTRNKGSFQVANDESARAGMRANSQAAVENQAKNENLKQIQKQAGIAGEAGLYGENLNATLGALGAENKSSEIVGSQPGWLQNTLGIMNALSNAGKATAA